MDYPQVRTLTTRSITLFRFAWVARMPDPISGHNRDEAWKKHGMPRRKIGLSG